MLLKPNHTFRKTSKLNVASQFWISAAERGSTFFPWSLLRGKSIAPRTPDGVRIYAIGDVHGRADLLTQLFAAIDADVAKYPSAEPVEVLLGDYIDRGPQSRQVLDLLIARSRGRRMVCLMGNHETYVSEFIRNPSTLTHWRHFGGLETLISYGMNLSMDPDETEQVELAAAFVRALPNSHGEFLSRLTESFACGDYFFVHAGVRPGVPLLQQKQEDFLWIRDDFLRHKGGYDKIIVHGHTPVAEPEIRKNRINIDTGAYASGKLTCLVLQGEDVAFL